MTVGDRIRPAAFRAPGTAVGRFRAVTGLPLAALAAGAAAAAALAALRAGGPAFALAAAGLAVLAVSLAALGRSGRLPPPLELAADLLVVGLLALAAGPEVRIWQAPGTFAALVRLSGMGAGILTLVYLAARMFGAGGGRLRPLAALAAPLLFNWLFALASPGFVNRLGAFAGAGALGPQAVLIAGRVIVLVVFNEAVAFLVCWLTSGRRLKDVRVHGLLVAAALLAAATPEVASLGSSTALAAWPRPLAAAAALAATAVSLAGLWAQTYLMTGLLMEAVNGKPPTWYWGRAHLGAGLAKGAIYGAVFMAFVQVLSLVGSDPVILAFLAANRLPAALVLGAAAFPFVRTVVESFDGSEPFLLRLARNSAAGLEYVRGALIGLGLLLALDQDLTRAGPLLRFGWGCALGAGAYAGVDLLKDFFDLARGYRMRLQTGRPYLAKMLMGAFAGGAIAWYFDALQAATVLAKFHQYAAIANPGAGLPVTDYVIYPLFSKWGATDLGQVVGGSRLLYNEALSGVINWSLAAPLFGVNLVFMNALFTRSLAPVRGLFSRQGLAGVAEQTIRVQRWGLWMAPIIYSFLRLAPIPTWYNQDGAVRTLVASYKSLTMATEAFRAWSLSVFVTLLASDWFRVLIWFDHMGLRVATLVNMSFTGGDALDEKTSRFMGHSARSRVIPEGLRRFATWAPLLIPFYIPRGADWDYAWSTAEAAQKAAGTPAWPPSVLVGAGILACALALGLASGRRRGAKAAPEVFTLANGLATLSLDACGRGNLRAVSETRHGQALDLTRRPVDDLNPAGLFFYLREATEEGGERAWSLGASPAGAAGASVSVEKIGRDRLRLVSTAYGVRTEAEVILADHEPLAVWRVRLTNLEARARRLELTSYREWIINDHALAVRHPAYNRLHVGTTFVGALGAVLAVNRVLANGARRPGRHLSHLTAFHAAAGASDGVRLVGYEDSRPGFLGRGTLAAPDALGLPLRPLEDEGRAYTFDPLASLRFELDLPAGGSVEAVFLDGCAPDELTAARRIAAVLHLPLPGEAELAAVLARPRVPSDGPRRPERARPGPRHSFSADGLTLTMAADTPRPWSHLLANPLGCGAVVSNDGDIYSFAANSQQNGLTPPTRDNVPAQVPGQVLYLRNSADGSILTPGFVPRREGLAGCDLVCGPGWATLRRRAGAVELTMTVCVLPEAPLEVRLVTVRNSGPAPAGFLVTNYSQMMLAEAPEDTRGRLKARFEPEIGAHVFENPDNDFLKGEAFVVLGLPLIAEETVRARFLGGRGRNLDLPFMVEHGRPDPEQAAGDGWTVSAQCGRIAVPAGGETRFVVILGQASRLADAARMIQTLREPEAAASAIARAKAWWLDRISGVHLETDRPEFDRLVNVWLPYQVLVSRLWGRTGPHQRSGGFGFRDQLQDVLPFCLIDPALARGQILLHGAQQFFSGDVLQWFHYSWEGKTGLGARNRASDPALWLPYVVSNYVEATDDLSILSEPLPFIEDKAIPRGHEGIMFAPRRARDTASLYVHCRRAVDRTLSRLGAHGLPLIGTGDWNDGLSEVGVRGRGESVWLGFFLFDVLNRLAGLAGRLGEAADESRWREAAGHLGEALAAMWRGERFVRAITDKGEELIFADALTAAWPVISDAAEPEIGATALTAALRDLERDQLIVLLAPPFDEASEPYPGRIASYPPGVRENGGQYSHGASWLVDALARLGDLAAAAGETSAAADWRAKAAEAWLKISPLGRTTPEEFERYGLPPHQQAADIYFGPGYEGRGGWSWYTGAAGRMLLAAYALFSIRFENGRLVPADDRFVPRGGLTLKRLAVPGAVLAAPGARGPGEVN